MRYRRKRLTRAAAARKRLEAVPADDGVIMVLVTERTDLGLRQRWEYQSPEEVRAFCQGQMARHDERGAYERWGGNQWGEGWVLWPIKRGYLEGRSPRLATDPSFEEYDLCREDRRSRMSSKS